MAPRLSLALLAAGSGLAAAQMTRLAFAGHSGMRVAWKSDSAGDSSACVYGTSANNMTMTATGEARSYFPGGGAHHRALLSGLQPNTAYFYSCGNVTGTNSFTTPPPPGSTQPFALAVFGDWGYLDSKTRSPTLPVGGLQANWSASLVRTLLEDMKDGGRTDFTWHVGDIAYEDDGFGHLDGLFNFTYERDYDGWMNWITNLTQSNAYMVSAGNHESECHSPYCILNLNTTGLKLNNFTAYNARWAMPSPESGGVANMWYSWDYGNAHFVSLNTETDVPGAAEEHTGDGGFAFLPAGSFAATGAYMAWLEADLAAAAANPNVTWILAGGHRPFESMPNANLITLFKKYGVDMYFAGHAHSASRFDPTAWGDSVHHITVGGAGCDEMPYPADQLAEAPLGGTDCRQWCQRPEVRESFASHAVPTDACGHCAVGRDGATPIYFSDKMAAGLLQISGKSLTYSLLRAPDGAVLDTVTLTKP